MMSKRHNRYPRSIQLTYKLLTWTLAVLRTGFIELEIYSPTSLNSIQFTFRCGKLCAP